MFFEGVQLVKIFLKLFLLYKLYYSLFTLCVKGRCVVTLKRDFLKSDHVILKSTSRKTFYQEFGLETLEQKILLEALLLIQIMQK